MTLEALRTALTWAYGRLSLTAMDEPLVHLMQWPIANLRGPKHLR
jgi:hypothetical protein